MPTAVEYAERYLQLTVPFDDGSVTVRVDRYHIGSPDAEQGKLWQDLKDHFRKEQGKNAAYRLKLRVNAEFPEFSSANEMLHRAVNPFWGKGSPEDCQIVLQLAVLFGRATKANLQSYCDDHLGLDCNGFVGNYLFRAFNGANDWRSDPAENAIGPSALIDMIMRNSGVAVATVEEMRSSRMYMLAEVDSANKIMPGGPGNPPGHIVVTEPGRYMAQSFVFDSFGGLDLEMARQDAYGHPAYWGVEATGGQGLIQSWYVIKPLIQGTKNVPGVFRVFRGSKGRNLNFRIRALTS
jgi:hypothetical protein